MLETCEVDGMMLIIYRVALGKLFYSLRQLQ